MLDSKLLRENLESVAGRLKTRGEDIDLSWFGDTDTRRREMLNEGETLKAERNKVSALIGKTKDKSTVQDEIARMKDVSARIKEIDEELRQLEDDLKGKLLTIPNLPDPACPVGAGEEENVEIRAWGEVPRFAFEAKAHWDLGKDLDILENFPAPGFLCSWGPARGSKGR